MDYEHNAAVSPSLRLRPHYSICPHCADIDFKTIERHHHKLNDLCNHCRYEYKKYLQFKYELEDTMRKLAQQRKARLGKVRQVAA